MISIIPGLVPSLFHALGTKGTQLSLSWDSRVPTHTCRQHHNYPHADHPPQFCIAFQLQISVGVFICRPTSCLDSHTQDLSQIGALRGVGEAYKVWRLKTSGSFSVVLGRPFRPYGTRRWCLGMWLLPAHSFTLPFSSLIHW